MTLDDAARTISDKLRLTPADCGRARPSRNVAAKLKIAWWVCRELCDCSLHDLAQWFSGRDHTTAIKGINQVEAKMREDRLFAEAMTALRDSVRAVNRERVREEL